MNRWSRAWSGPVSQPAGWAPNASVYVNHVMGVHGLVTGRAGRLAWDFGDGTTTTNVGYFTSHAWSTAGVYSVTLTAYNTGYPAGVSCNVQLNVLPIAQPPLAAVSWTTNGFQVQFPVQSNLVYTLQWATNLTPPVAWQSHKPASPMQMGCSDHGHGSHKQRAVLPGEGSSRGVGARTFRAPDGDARTQMSALHFSYAASRRPSLRISAGSAAHRKDDEDRADAA